MKEDHKQLIAKALDLCGGSHSALAVRLGVTPEFLKECMDGRSTLQQAALLEALGMILDARNLGLERPH